MELQEKNESLWTLALPPVIWAAHFLLCYVTAAIWCAKVAGRYGSLGSVRVAIGVLTVVALGGIGLAGWRGLRRHRFGGGATPHDFDTPEDRHGFLGFASLLLAGLSAVAVLYTALVALFIETCH